MNTNPSNRQDSQSGQEELAVIKAAQASKISLVIEDLQNPNTILSWGAQPDSPLTRLTWSELEEILQSHGGEIPETVCLFLDRLSIEKWRLHLLWKHSALIHEATTHRALLKAIVLPLDALLGGTICWIEIAV